MLKTVDIPSALETTTADWLTKTLRKSGVLAESDSVVSLTVEPLSGSGTTGQMARIKPFYERCTDNKPPSFIAKYSHADPNFSQKFSGANAKEIRVYQELFDHISLPMPRCYFSEIDMTTGQSLLLLEDLGHMRQKSFAQGFSLAEAETIVYHLACHHAQWWQSPQLQSLDYVGWMSANIHEQWLTDYQQSWSRFEDSVTDLVPDCYMPASFLEIGYRYGFERPEIEKQIVNTQFTFIHNDIHPSNVMFAANKTDRTVAVIDWQACVAGPGPRDIGYFLIFSLPVKQRRQVEQKLLRSYHAILVEQGVANYSFEQCLRDYRLSFFLNLHNLVHFVGLGHVDLEKPYAVEALKAIIPRTASFAEDHCVSEFL